jgi:acyl carrier protein
MVQQTLGGDPVAIDDNFFDVGGNSLLALTLIAEIEKRYGATIHLIDVVHNPTPEGLARLIAESGQGHGAGAGTGQAPADGTAP